MPAVNFYLDTRSKAALKRVFCVVTHEGEQFPIRPGRSIPPENWDKKRKSVKGSSETLNEVRDVLNMIREIIEDKIPAEFEAIGIHYPTPAQIREAYETKYRHLVEKPVTKETRSEAKKPSRAMLPVHQRDFVEYMLEYHALKVGKMTNHGILRYKIVARELEWFRKKYEISTKVGDIDKVFWEKFSNFILHEEVKDETGRILKDRNVDVTLCSKLKKVNSVIEFFDLPMKTVKIKTIVSSMSDRENESFKHLESDEVMDVWEFNDFAKEPWLEAYRDAFVFNCFTGPRHNELISLTSEDVIDVMNPDGSGTIKTLRYKVSKQHGKPKMVEVPLNTIALQIIEKYQQIRRTRPFVNEWTDTNRKQKMINSDPLLKVNSNQKSNKYIKRLLFLVGLRQMSRHYKTKITEANYREFKPIGLISPEDTFVKRGNRTETVVMPRYETITCHSGRHSFACNLVEAGVDLYKVSKFLGHGSTVTTEKYYAKMKRMKLLSGVVDKFEVSRKAI